MVAALVEADAAQLFLGQVPALAAEAHALLHLLKRGRERERLVSRPLEDVEREPLRGARADPRQAGQLRDEVLDGRAEHRAIVPSGVGYPGRALARHGRWQPPCSALCTQDTFGRAAA